jgi:Uma2 family endonuclease
MSQIAEPKTRYTVAEYDQLPESMLPTELIDGEILVSPAPLLTHQLVLGNLYYFLRISVPGGVVAFAPVDVQLDDSNVFQPDLLWIAEGNERCTVTEQRVIGAPDLVVEIVSKGTERRDRVQKFQLYEKYGVREYWIIDLKLKTVQVWSLQGSEFISLGSYTVEETFESPALQKAVIVADAFPKTT